MSQSLSEQPKLEFSTTIKNGHTLLLGMLSVNLYFGRSLVLVFVCDRF
ncbi:hypothetical protein I8751_06100 [Nostocaceae cyanobacterium CENA357]|uniref:Uncharacterized protein n=1 Tax=Atlanticothrix silvestris CENA357 TaxID=1725252 RepID=A0A8J7L2R4_9CYAN|nr:hypothetical protein [Atlanticothrix silvestris]MBH8551957.1 hypothetical protein [Atlanticothrix silvestris CENA357]